MRLLAKKNLFGFNIGMKINYSIPKLPLPYSYGNIAQRRQNVREFNRQIFERILSQCGDSGSCFFSDVQKIINEFTGDTVKIHLRNTSPWDNSGSTKLITKKGKVKGIKIAIPFDKFFDMDIRTLPILMHELSHSTSYLVFPKYIKSHMDCFQGEIFKKRIWRFYDNRIYKKEFPKTIQDKEKILKSLEKDLNKLLLRYPPQKRILYLNELRYTIETEIEAYNAGYEFAKQINKKVKPLINIKDVYTKDNFLFTEKLELVNKILYETIAKERSNPEPIIQKKNMFFKMLDRLFVDYDE